MFALVLSTVVGPLSPVVKVGGCPLGWYSSGAYCVPARDTTREAIQKAGTCPLSWYSSASYCVR